MAIIELRLPGLESPDFPDPLTKPCPPGRPGEVSCSQSYWSVPTYVQVLSIKDVTEKRIRHTVQLACYSQVTKAEGVLEMHVHCCSSSGFDQKASVVEAAVVQNKIHTKK